MLESLHFGRGWRKTKLSRAKTWLAKHVHVEQVLLALILVASVVLLILILLNRIHLYSGDIEKFSNRLYLMSAIAQSLAAILSLVVSLTLIATQLAAQTYSPRVVNLRLRDPWLWGAVGLYIIAILWALEAHGEFALQWQKSADIALLLGGAALFYLVPFTIATLHSLDPRHIARRLAKGSSAALDDMMRKAVNEPLMSLLEDGLNALKSNTIHDLERNSDKPEEREKVITESARLFRGIGRHACQATNTDAFERVQNTLSLLTEHCAQHKWLTEARSFNRDLFELDDYFVYTFEEELTIVRLDIAWIRAKQASRFYDIAQVLPTNREANLRRTISGYRSALQVYTYERYPMDYAITQNNLGKAYAALSEVQDKEDNLKSAIDACSQALKVLTVDAFPVDYAHTTFDIGNVHLQSGNFPKAEKLFQEAEQVFRKQGSIDWADRAHKAAELVREQVDE